MSLVFGRCILGGGNNPALWDRWSTVNRHFVVVRSVLGVSVVLWMWRSAFVFDPTQNGIALGVKRALHGYGDSDGSIIPTSNRSRSISNPAFIFCGSCLLGGSAANTWLGAGVSIALY